jgi:hypothetical protein
MFPSWRLASKSFGLLLERAAVRLLRAVGVGHSLERLSQQRVDAGQARVELGGAPQLVACGPRVARPQLRRSHQQAGLGGVAPPQHAVDEDLAALEIVLADERAAEEVRVGAVLAERCFVRGEQLHDLRGVSLLQLALGEQQQRALVVGLLLDHERELAGRLRKAGRLVEGEAQVEADRRVGLVAGQRLPVLLDRLGVTAQPRVRRPQVGPHVRAVGALLQDREVGIDRAENVAGPVEGHRPVERGVGIRVLRRPRESRPRAGRQGHGDQKQGSDSRFQHGRARR